MVGICSGKSISGTKFKQELNRAHTPCTESEVIKFCSQHSVAVDV